MANTQRLKLSLNLYINYLVFGMAIVILAQNMTVLSQQWHTTVAGVSYVISSIGIGRLLVLYISGVLSDKYGRKPFVLLGMGTYIPFFVGITFSPNMYVAYGCGILAGMANSFLDAGTYPALMELYPQKPATANIVIKAFASTGELILPIMVTIIEHYHGWFGLSFMTCTLIFIINFLFISRKTFPKVPRVTPKTAASAAEPKAAFTLNQKVNAVALTVYGYISMATFYLVSQWLTKYGQVALKWPPAMPAIW
jgi:MFS family permease